MRFILGLAQKHKHTLFWSIPLVVIVAMIILALPAEPVTETKLFIGPEEGIFAVDSRIVSTVRINANQPINAIEAVISFPPDILEVEQVSAASSILNIWLEEASFSNPHGTVRFIGGLPHPGFFGINGEVLEIVFRAKQQGEAHISIDSASVLASDGVGTEALEETAGGRFNIVPARDIFDLNGDDAINVIDIGIFLSLWRNPDNHILDFNGDGTVDLLDLGILLSHVGN